ncbi:MAG: hypothetical protein AAFZ87_11395, partial [Planctomycetota bacterium]
RIPTLALLGLLTLSTGCQNTGPGRRTVAGPLDDGLLQFVDEGARDRIRTARIEHIEAQDATAAAEFLEKASRGRRRTLSADVRAAAKRLKDEERRVAQAVRDGDVARAEASSGDVQEARDELASYERAAELQEAQSAELRALVALERAEESHALAVIDLFKARALLGTGRPDTADIDLALYERVERERETQIELAKTVLRAAQRELHIAETDASAPVEVGAPRDAAVESVDDAPGGGR